MAMIDRVLTTDEEQFLSDSRVKLNITEAEHQQVVKTLGWSENELADAKKDSEKVSECVVCMEAPANHVVMDCMHLCLCADCAMMYNGIYKDNGCPNCRADITRVAKIY
jgi:hypothetical protein